jgi:hypothetical protein
MSETKLKPQQFHKAISALLTEKLRPLLPQDDGTSKDLNLVTCVEIYTTIFESLVEVVTTSGIEVTNEGMNYLAQQYYDGILINGHQELDPNIFTQRAKVENMETEELTLLAVMLVGTDFALPVLEEIRKRR